MAVRRPVSLSFSRLSFLGLLRLHMGYGFIHCIFVLCLHTEEWIYQDLYSCTWRDSTITNNFEMLTVEGKYTAVVYNSLMFNT